MSKKVLVLSASPRKGGNSDLLCDQFMLGTKEEGNQAEKIFISDKKINYCLGCITCQRNSGICIQEDDMNEIIDKMIKADVLVMATPVYFYTMNAQMKTLIDRALPRYKAMQNKDVYIIIAAMDNRKEEMEGVFDSFRCFIHCLPGAEEKGFIYGTGTVDRGDINNSSEMRRAYEMGRNV